MRVRDRVVEVKVKVSPWHVNLVMSYNYGDVKLEIPDADKLVLTRKLVEFVVERVKEGLARAGNIPKEKLEIPPWKHPEYFLYLPPAEIVKLFSVTSRNKSCKTLQKIMSFLREVEGTEPREEIFAIGGLAHEIFGDD